MRAFLLLTIAATALAGGCASVTPEQRRTADERTCAGYGFRARSNAFAECLQRIDLDRAADRRARLYGDGFIGTGYGLGVGGPTYRGVW